MNTQLMIPVERTVRPILASHRRLLRMREELYSLIEARYQSCLAEGCSEEEATRRARLAFGDPVRLRIELQQTVPVCEQLSRRLDRFLYQNFQAPTVAQAIRTGLLLMIPMAILMIGLGILLAWVKPHGMAEALWPVNLAISAVFGINAALVHWLAPRTVADILAGRWHQVACRVAAMAGCVGVSFAGLYAVADWDFFLRSGWLRGAASALAGGGISLLVCWLVSLECQQRAPWEELDLAE